MSIRCQIGIHKRFRYFVDIVHVENCTCWDGKDRQHEWPNFEGQSSTITKDKHTISKPLKGCWRCDNLIGYDIPGGTSWGWSKIPEGLFGAIEYRFQWPTKAEIIAGPKY